MYFWLKTVTMKIVVDLFIILVLVFAVGIVSLALHLAIKHLEAVKESEKKIERAKPSVAVKNKHLRKVCGRREAIWHTGHFYFSKPDICNTCHDFRIGLE